jgi:5S rRNA maturation endonuclease (ribonuclease M5)
MNYSTKDLGFILYNNRSTNMISKHLDSKMNPHTLIKIEKEFDWCKSIYEDLENFVEVDLSLLSSDSEDIIILPEDIKSLTDIINSAVGQFSKEEYDFIEKRNFPKSWIEKWKLFGLSSIKNPDILDKIGATCHPILRSFLSDGINEGGICQPLFNSNGELINCSIRRISDVGKLKYTLAVPDTPVWGLDDIKGEEVWICEGLFDMMTLREMGVKAVSPSSAMWSGIQLYQLLDKKPSAIIIMVDNDRVGFKTGLILTKFFNIQLIPSVTVHSTIAKDASEHFLEKRDDFENIKSIKITRQMIESKKDDSFNFLKYLQTRKF